MNKRMYQRAREPSNESLYTAKKIPVFRPMHSKHARKLYKRLREQAKYYKQNNYLVAPRCVNSQNEYYIKRANLLKGSGYQRKRRHSKKLGKSQIPLDSGTPIVKVATITARPRCEKNKSRPSLELESLKCSRLMNQELLSKKIKEELSCSTIFKMLGEISKDEWGNIIYPRCHMSCSLL